MIDLELEAHVAVATMRGAPVNALNAAWLAQFEGVLEAAESDPAISVLRIRSDLRVFSAGADLAVMREWQATADGRDQMIDFVRALQDAYFRLERARVVTIAEIGGAALGGGLELALACDFRVASQTAKIGLPEARLGLLPGAGGTQRLTRICGEAVARRLILGAEVIDGRAAQELGVVHWATESDDLGPRVDELCVALGAATGPALAACKRCIAASADAALDGYERELSETRRLNDLPETRARVHDFLEKRG